MELGWLWNIADVLGLPRLVDVIEEDALEGVTWLWDVAKVLEPKFENANVSDVLTWLRDVADWL